MHDLEQMLDNVLSKYYRSSALPKPSIRWSDKPWLRIGGIYYLSNNEIQINCAFNTKDASRFLLEYLIYHETVHQDFAPHDEFFFEKERMYPNWEKAKEEISLYFDNVLPKYFRYQSNQPNYMFEKGKTQVVYLMMPEALSEVGHEIDHYFFYENLKYQSDLDFSFPDALTQNNCSNLYVFLAQDPKKSNYYHIMGWCDKGNLYSQSQCSKGFPDKYRAPYNFTTSPDNLFLLVRSNVQKHAKNLPTSFFDNGYYCKPIDDSEAKKDLKYMNHYNLNFSPLYDSSPEVVAAIPPYLDCLTFDELADIAFKEEGIRAVLASNALFQKQPCLESAFILAEAQQHAMLYSLSLNSALYAHCLNPEFIDCVSVIIFLCAMCDDFLLGKRFVDVYEEDLQWLPDDERKQQTLAAALYLKNNGQ